MGTRESTIDCLFRRDVVVRNGEESARCTLLQAVATGSAVPLQSAAITDPPDKQLGPSVPRAACLACEHGDNRALLNKKPVFASLVYQALESVDEESPNGTAVADRPIYQWTVETLCGNPLQPEVHATSGCDVFVRCKADDPNLEATLTAIAAQQQIFITLYLTGDVPVAWAERARDDARVVIATHPHASHSDESLWTTARRWLPQLGSQFVAIVEDDIKLTPLLLSQAVERLAELGAEAVSLERLSEAAKPPVDGEPVSAIVVRRATLADLRTTRISSSLDFLRSARHQRRPIAGEIAVRQIDEASRFVELDEPVDMSGLTASANECPPRCDIVLPFHNQLDFVTDALAGLLVQDIADVVIHLIDDCSTVSTDDFLQHWSTHPAVRTYRNRENIGQFSSFNNVSRFFETEYAAIQDADDISLPHRIAWSVSSIELSDADFFAGAVQLFGDCVTVVPEQPECETFMQIAVPLYRRSHYPPLGRVRYFAENPTLVMRVDAFRNLGGFADFGDPLANRASIDTEFQCRALLAGRRFTISQCVVLKYRVHGGSATQNTTTGWKTAARNKSQLLADNYRSLQQQGPFDPRVFGALDRYVGITERYR